MIKKKRNLFIKLGLCVSAFIGLVCSLCVPSKAYEYGNVSLLDLNNLKSATLYYICEDNNNPKYHYTFVKNGVFGYEENFTWNLNLSDFITDSTIQTRYQNNIYTPYGMFYDTNWSIYDFIWEESSYPGIVTDEQSYLEYVFIAPILINNTYFNNTSFTAIEFYDSNDYLLGVWVSGSFNVSLNGVAKIRCSSETSDYVDEETYLICGLDISQYNIGYRDGVNSQQTVIDDLQNQINQLDNANSVLQQQLNNASSTNANALFWTIASTPFESFKTIWNVDVLGLNISGFVLGVLMALLILYIIKKVW